MAAAWMRVRYFGSMRMLFDVACYATLSAKVTPLRHKAPGIGERRPAIDEGLRHLSAYLPRYPLMERTYSSNAFTPFGVVRQSVFG